MSPVAVAVETAAKLLSCLTHQQPAASLLLLASLSSNDLLNDGDDDDDEKTTCYSIEKFLVETATLRSQFR